MSKKVDERVVEMRFDNKDFESNIKTSMSTLDKLKQSLKLKDAAKGLENIGNAAKKVDMGPIGKGVETVQAKFSAMQVVAMTCLSNITNAAFNAGKHIVSALTIEPIMSGFQEYETQINAIQTILANTKNKGTTLDQVNSALDELNTYADKTIYNFTEMTRNIGTFTAAGVDLDTSVSAIKGIANLAALSGSNAQQASSAMYQLSQALASGTVKLQDWNSVVNAGMGGQVFQDALMETARVHGIAIDDMIKKEGSFRETLQNGWLSSEILTETLAKFTGDLTEAQITSMGYTEEQAKKILELGQTANNAATKVKTFTQLWDTLKEAAQSGWTQSWEIIIGDFVEAQELLTEISDTVSEFINKQAEARNNLLQGWKDLGGRTALIDSFRNAFEGLGSIIKPISEAFREIFPPITAKQLYNFTDGLKKLTEHLKISGDTANKLKRTFKGIFSIFSIGIDAIKALGKGAFELIGHFSGMEGGILGVTASIGDWISGLRDSIKETDLFGKAVEKATKFLGKIVDGIKDFGKSIAESLSSGASSEGLVGVFESLLGIVTKSGQAFAEGLVSFSTAIGKAINEGGFYEILNGTLLAGILKKFNDFLSGFKKGGDESEGIMDKIKGMLDGVRDSLKAWQSQLKASTLMTLAAAVGILAGSLLMLSKIDADSMAKALAGLSGLFAELLVAFKILNKIDSGMTGVIRTSAMMIGLSISITILASALKKLSTLDMEGIAKGLVGVGGLMAELSLFINKTKFSGKMIGTATGIVILSSAMLILASAVKKFGGMKWSEIGKGLASIGALLTEISLFTKLTGNTKKLVSTGAAMVLLGASMKIFASALKVFGSMDLGAIGRGLLAMGGALAEVAIAMKVMPTNTIAIGAGLVVVGAALKMVANALSKFGGMSFDEIGRGLIAMAGALAELSIALNLMKGTISGASALILAAGALSILAPVLKGLGSMSWGSIAKGLIAMAGAFTVIGVAATLLTPAIPAILGISAAFLMLGTGVAAIGYGVALLRVGDAIGAIAGMIPGFSTSMASFVAGLKILLLGIIDLIPSMAEKIAEGVVRFAKAIGDAAPQLADAFLKLISGVLDSLKEYAPKIVNTLLDLLIDIINGLADHIPSLIQAAMNFIGKLFDGIVDALSGIDTESLLKGTIAVGIMTAMMYALSGVVALIPSAMAGMLGVGAVIAEMSLVLAAVGALKQIPGLDWLIGEGGELLQTIGTAIGKFVGGIVGGVGQGLSGSLPQIASDLSMFMTNLQPFVEGAKNLDPSMLDGVNALAKTILILTAAEIVDGIASFLGGGSSLASFAEQLVPFGKAISKFSDTVKDIDAENVQAAANAGKMLAEMSATLPKSGGLVSFFSGDSDISEFTEQLVPFGKAMSKFSNVVKDVDPVAVEAAANAGKMLAELATSLPNSGGVVSFFTGDNDLSSFGEQLVPFGKAMAEFSNVVKNVDPAAVEAAANAGKMMSELAKTIPNSGGVLGFFAGENDLSSFGEQLVPFGKAMAEFSNVVQGVDPAAVEAAANAGKMMSELATSLPNSGGVISFFTGENDLSSFGEQLVPFGKAMAAFSNSVVGLNVDAVEAAANAGKIMAALSTTIPNSGGVLSFFTGEHDMAAFGAQLVPFGASMKAFSNSVVGLNVEAVEAAANAGKIMAELSTTIPNSGGVISFFMGDKDMATFGTQLVSFGQGMKRYSEAVSGMDVESVTASIGAAKALIKLSDSIQNNSGGFFSVFTGDNSLASVAEQLVPFGKAMSKYAGSVSGMDVGAVSSSVAAAKSILSFMNNIGNVNSGSVAGFVEALNTLGTASVQKFISAFQNGAGQASAAVTNMINTAANAANGAAPRFGAAGAAMMNALSSSFIANSGLLASVVTVSVASAASVVLRSVGLFQAAGNGMSLALVNGAQIMRAQLPPIFAVTMATCVVTVANAAPLFYTAGGLISSQFANGIRGGISGVISAVSSMTNAAKSACKADYSAFYSAGLYVARGFANGIQSGGFAAATAARAMALAAKRAAESALDEHSPSKVFKKIGAYASEGMAIGIDEKAHYAENSAEAMANSVIDGAKTAVSGIGGIISNGLEIEPSISPVVDMTGANAGLDIKSLNATIDMLINKPVESISDLMAETQYAINASNMEVIDAINGLRSDLNALYEADDSELALYIDSKKIASTIAKPMNRQLSILAKKGGY